MRISLFLFVLYLTLGCTKSESSNRTNPEVETSEPYEITNTTILAGGVVTHDGGGEIVERGLFYHTTPDPVTHGNKQEAGRGPGGFTSRIKDLEPNTVYYLQAYAINKEGMGLGKSISVTTTLIHMSTLTAQAVTANSALLGGEITGTEGISINERGIFIGTVNNPIETGIKQRIGEGSGKFQERVGNLSEHTTYYYAAFAMSPDGLSYGETRSFTTTSTTGIYLNVEGNQLGIPYHRNLPLGADNFNITRAIIVVHGLDRAGERYFETISGIASEIPEVNENTIIISPQFLTEDDILEQGLNTSHLYWSTSGWATGALSQNTTANPRPARVSSYALLDTVMYRLANSLPNLQRLVLVGHSAGGQLAQRMAVTSPTISAIMEEYQIPVRIIVTNPSSYVYLTAERWEVGTTYSFSVPITDCIPYNDYIYGFNQLYAYSQDTPEEDMRNWYKDREVIYFLGGSDNNPNASLLDVTCQAMLQGRHRLERGQIFYQYVQHLYGPEILDKHRIEVVSGVGHTHIGMFSSAQGRDIIFSIE
jgi:pimeloyl-ACP methyl ester carboxylesterase